MGFLLLGLLLSRPRGFFFYDFYVPRDSLIANGSCPIVSLTISCHLMIPSMVLSPHTKIAEEGLFPLFRYLIIKIILHSTIQISPTGNPNLSGKSFQIEILNAILEIRVVDI